MSIDWWVIVPIPHSESLDDGTIAAFVGSIDHSAETSGSAFQESGLCLANVGLWPNFPVPSHALVVDPPSGERQVTAQTRNFSQALYKQPLNETNRPYLAVPEIAGNGENVLKRDILPQLRGAHPVILVN